MIVVLISGSKNGPFETPALSISDEGAYSYIYFVVIIHSFLEAGHESSFLFSSTGVSENRTF